MKPYIKPKELASYLGVSRSLISKWVRQGCPFVNIGASSDMLSPRFKIDEVEAWLKNRQVKGDA